MENCVGSTNDTMFNDNSSLKRGRFKLGARVKGDKSNESIGEAVSGAFKVKDCHGKAFRRVKVTEERGRIHRNKKESLLVLHFLKSTSTTATTTIRMTPRKCTSDRAKSPPFRWESASLKAKNELLWKIHLTRYFHKAVKIQAEILSELRWMRSSCEQPRSSINQPESLSGSRKFQLQFDCTLPDVMFSLNSIEADGPQGPVPVKIIALDESKNIVKDGPLSSIKVDIVALKSDFMVESMEDWTEDEFNANIVHNNKYGAPLLAGECEITLRDGVGLFEKLSFTDNSSFLHNRKVRLAAKVAKGVLVSTRMREAVSGAIWVKDGRGRSNQKHPIPSLDDDVCCLERIGRNGIYRDRLVCHGINKVKDLLQHFYIDQSSLRNILGMSGKTWEKVTRHARLCILDSEHHKYYSAEKGIKLLFNCVYNLVGVSFDGGKYQSLATLNKYQKDQVEILRRQALKNPNELVKIDFPPDYVSDETISLSTSPVFSQEDLIVPASDHADKLGGNLSPYSQSPFPGCDHRQPETEEPICQSAIHPMFQDSSLLVLTNDSSSFTQNTLDSSSSAIHSSPWSEFPGLLACLANPKL